jgi:hypothetical protein
LTATSLVGVGVTSFFKSQSHKTASLAWTE